MTENNTTLQIEIAELMVQALNLDTTAAEIDPEAPLYGDGLGLDSIDALELIVLLQQKYNVKLANPQEGPKIFKSVRTMAEFITANQTA